MQEMWPTSQEALVELQLELAARARREPPWRPPADLLAIGGVFATGRRGVEGVGEAGEPAWASAVLMEGGRLLARATLTGSFGAPYRPGLLALRSGPLLAAAVQRAGALPDVLLVDATGLDHPRGAGLALHLGAALDVPTIGVTDRPLAARAEAQPGDDRGSAAPLLLAGTTVGYLVRTRPAIRPVYAHGAWMTSPEVARDVVLQASHRSRTPEPLRQARRLARVARSGLDSPP